MAMGSCVATLLALPHPVNAMAATSASTPTLRLTGKSNGWAGVRVTDRRPWATGAQGYSIDARGLAPELECFPQYRLHGGPAQICSPLVPEPAPSVSPPLW